MNTIKIEKRGAVTVLTLSRPEALNALNAQLLGDLERALADLRADRSSRAVVVTGEGGKAFAAGADIKEMRDLGPEGALELALRGQRVLKSLEDLPQMTVAAVNGFALGGGLELALACDFIVASNKARLGLPEVSLGLIPGYGGTQRLVRLVGYGWAKRIVLTGEMLAAEEARALGLVTEVAEPEALLERALALATLAASRSPEAVALAKRAILGGFDRPLADGLALEADCFSKAFATANSQEGLRAFLEKRSPQFN
jgi:enoyl-CoA hydratase